MGQEWYYDFVNPNVAISKALVKGGIGMGLFHYIKDIASVKISTFRYKNIERIKGLTSEMLETFLLFGHNLCFYDSPSLGIVLCRYVCTDTLDIYLKPNTVTLTTLNGVTIATNVPYSELILVRDNAVNIPPIMPMIEYIRKVEQCDTAVFKVLNVASLPLALIGSKKVANQLNEIAKKIGCGDAFIVGDERIMDNVKGFNIDVPVMPNDIYELKTKYKNELLSSIGIYSIEEKRERKIVSEVASQNDYTDTIYQDMVSQRKRFVEELNKLDPSLGIALEETYEITRDATVEETKLMAEANAAGNGGNNNATEME